MDVKAPESTSSFEELRHFCAQVREMRLRDPEMVTKCGAELLRNHWRRLSADEVWELHEQVAVSAMDIGAMELSLGLVQNVHRQFPDGARASRLTGMYFEAMGKFGEAERLYKKELERDPMNARILKRMAALKRGQGDVHGAAEALKSYLSTHMLDVAAWEELADLYLQLQMHQQAAHCLEELLMHQPSNVGYHLLYADTMYSLGGAQNWRTARTYYSGVLEMTNGRELRALYGACACAAQLAGARGGGRGAAGGEGEGSQAAAGELGKLCGEALLQRYALQCSDKLPLVKAMLKGQGLL